jgi:uncharacterized membrane protein
MKRIRWFAVVFSLLVSCATVFAQNTLKFTLTDLGTFGGSFSNALGINNSGHVVGYYSTGSTTNCFYYSPGIKGSSTWGSTVTGICQAYAINSFDVIAGTMTAPNHTLSAFTGIRNTKLRTVTPTYLSSRYGLETDGYWIDDKGVVTGTAYSASDHYAALWNSEYVGSYGQLTIDITSAGTQGDRAGLSWSFNQDLNNESFGDPMSEVGTSSDNVFLWCQNLLPQPFGGSKVNAQASVNNSIQPVGYSIASDGTFHAVRWLNATYTYMVFDLGDGSPSWATGISTDGWIVGQFGSSGSLPFLQEPTLYGCSSAFDLNKLLDSSGTGWTLQQVNGINDSHQIVGAGTINGAFHAFLLTPNGAPLCSS